VKKGWARTAAMPDRSVEETTTRDYELMVEDSDQNIAEVWWDICMNQPQDRLSLLFQDSSSIDEH
jgi:hypothetical protein